MSAGNRALTKQCRFRAYKFPRARIPRASMAAIARRCSNFVRPPSSRGVCASRPEPARQVAVSFSPPAPRRGGFRYADTNLRCTGKVRVDIAARPAFSPRTRRACRRSPPQCPPRRRDGSTTGHSRDASSYSEIAFFVRPHQRSSTSCVNSTEQHRPGTATAARFAQVAIFACGPCAHSVRGLHSRARRGRKFVLAGRHLAIDERSNREIEIGASA